MNTTSHVYFPNLDGLRFIAAFMVIVHHIEQLKVYFGLQNNWDNEIIKSLGMLGVILFLVLSGFLISYLLFKEQDTTRDIGIKKFYLRRILRIWPLYFFVIGLALFVLPYVTFLIYPGAVKLSMETKFYKALPLYLLFLPNYVLVSIATIPFCSQTWSIGVEEQFYLIWPALNKLFKNKLTIIISMIGIYLLIKYIVILKVVGAPQNSLLFQFWESMPIHFMAIGAFFAYVSFFETKFTSPLKSILYNRVFQMAIVALMLVMLIFGIKIMYFNLEIYAVFFAVMIINAATGPSNLFYLNFSFFKYLGKISYGLYMYHLICIVLTINILNRLNAESNNILIYILSIFLTIVVASISYHTLEKYFLNLKNRYTVIKSGSN
jgi:peptidoglycan/LPS O-acetylase OafA/YrhL